MKLTPKMNELAKSDRRLFHALEAANILEKLMMFYYKREYKIDWDSEESDPAASIKLEVDKKCDALARSYLTTVFDDASKWGFIGEESYDESERRKEYYWCVDPICGSLAFQKKKRNFGTSIALFHKGEPILGVMNCPLYRWRGAAILEPKKGVALAPEKSARKTNGLSIVVSFNKKSNPILIDAISRFRPDKVTYAESIPAKAMGVLIGYYDLFYSLPKSLGGGRYNIWDIGATAAFAAAGESLLTDAFGEPLNLKQQDYRFERGIIMTKNKALLRLAAEKTKALAANKKRIHPVPAAIVRPSNYYVIGLKCVVCGVEYKERPELLTCPACGDEGILDVQFDYEAIKQVLTPAALAKNPDPSHWRYMPILPVRDPVKIPTLRIGGSPLYDAQMLAAKIGVKRLLLKDDGINPTASLKDRASGVGAARAMAEGAKAITCASTGNAASSLAGSAASIGMPSFIFVPEKAPAAKVAQLLIFGANVFVVEGSYEDAFHLSMFCAERFGFYNRNSGINPWLVEGKKTVSLEISEKVKDKVPDYVFVAVGDGCTIAGVWKGFCEMRELGFIPRLPRLIGVQASGASPVMKVWQKGGNMKPVVPKTLADSIAVGTPRNWRKAVKAVQDSMGFYMSVNDDEILRAMKMLGNTCGIFAEPAGATGLAGVIKAARKGMILPDASVAAIISGNGLKDVSSAQRAAGSACRVPPDTDALDKILTAKKTLF
ncbi:MAG: Threonine synthase [candidate division BRC1 bacterium ADurb.Bin183]|nr:MAG: Threonine synthase [candidate division BRC1 bacterium ADurb.Bin183]